MTNKSIILTLIVFFLLIDIAIVGVLIFMKKFKSPEPVVIEINDFESCVAAGNPVMESYPRQCSTSDGKHFTEILSEEEKKKFESVPVTECQDFEITECPANCSICPPCATCSSISCQTTDFCEKLGFTKDWYNEIIKPNGFESETTVKSDEKEKLKTTDALSTTTNSLTVTKPYTEPVSSPNCVSSCGDGACQDIACLAIGCPCIETAESCPQDCARDF